MEAICLSCIGDKALRARLTDMAEDVLCSCCNETAPGLTIDNLAAAIDETLRNFCDHGDEYPTFTKDSDKPYYEQHGVNLTNLLEEELSIEYEAAEALANALIESDPADYRDGEEPFYTDEQSYERRHIYGAEYDFGWERFSTRIKHERRFFDDEARGLLEMLIGEKDSDGAKELPITEIGAAGELEILFRARPAASEAEALQILKSPESELGPPPAAEATPGRMNPAGIPVFYGALSAETAIAEVRPSVGGLVVVGQFRPKKTLRLLDLTRLNEVKSAGSIFAPDYGERTTRLAFLSGFHTLIAKAVQPHDEPIEYIPTQVVAEYVSSALGLDGIIYGSAQVGALPDENTHPDDLPFVKVERNQQNVVLLGGAATVAGRKKRTRKKRGRPEKRSRLGFASAFDSLHEPRQPARLEFVPKSAEDRRVTAVTFTSERAYVYDPDKDWKF